MKLLHIISQNPDFTGSGKFLQAIVKEARKDGIKNFLLAGIQKDFTPDDDFINQIVAPQDSIFIKFDGPDIDFPLPGMSDVMPYKSSRFKDLNPDQISRYEQIFQEKIHLACERFKPDLIHTHHLWFATAIARKTIPNIPIVTTCHGTCIRQFESVPALKGVAVPCAQLDGIMALTKEQRKKIIDTYQINGRKIHVTGSGFDADCFMYTEKNECSAFPDRKDDTDEIQILYAGKLSSPKGVPWLLKTMSELCHHPWQLHLAGTSTGKEKKRCLNLARKMGDRVIFHGNLSHDALSRLMGKCHLFILPSFFEGLPLVLLEALACGCRIITTALPGSRELFENSDPDLVTMIELPVLETIDRPFNKDIPLLEKRLKDAIEKSFKRIQKKPTPDCEKINGVVKKFNWKETFRRIKKVYDEALDKKEN